MRCSKGFAALVAVAIGAVAVAPCLTRSQTVRVCNGNQCRTVSVAQFNDAGEMIENGKVYVRGADGVFRLKVEQPPAAGAVYDGPLPTGVLGLRSNAETYSVNGVKVDEAKVVESLIGGKQPSGDLRDDTGKLIVSVIDADEKEAEKIAAELKAKVGGEGFRFWSGSANDWSFEPGFSTAGRPTIYCQAPDGKVLHRQDDYAGGAEAAAEAIRKAKSSYDPAKDVDRRKANLSLPSGANWFMIIAGLVAVFLLTRQPAPAK